MRRTVIVDTVHHIPDRGEVLTVESRYSLPTKSNKPPHAEVVDLGDCWEPVAFDWIDPKAAVVILKNTGDTTVLLSGGWRLLPGESMRGTPPEIGLLLLGPGRVEVTILPR